ncbi:hypothetical protein BGX24_009275 [Mortierella sp. AD032]|nr:hypothetical protein BGX24_009275 [Mortierella sp. AD032]
MLSNRWLLCWLSCAIITLYAAPLPSPIASSIPLLSSNSHQRRSNVFEELLNSSPLNLNPPNPTIPNVFVPMTTTPEAHPELPHPIPATANGGGTYSNSPRIVGNGVPIWPLIGFPDVAALTAECAKFRAPELSVTIPLEVGIVRLFRQSSYRDEAVVVKGCGCITLESPIAIESYVGSPNHSFMLYTGDKCQNQPYHQRFIKSYDVEPNLIAASIRIFQGVMLPIPTNDPDHERFQRR